MTDGVHVRLMVTRGVKRTPYQDPRVTVGPATVVMIPEYKEPLPAVVERGIRLFTVHVRRPYPDVLDPKLNVHSKLNDIMACIQATRRRRRGAHARPARVRGHVQLDPLLRRPRRRGVDVVGAYCLGGITRETVLRVAARPASRRVEKQFSLTDVYGADEAFVTGTFAGLVPVREVDGRTIGDAGRRPAR